jgi:hypothetical protein
VQPVPQARLLPENAQVRATICLVLETMMMIARQLISLASRAARAL